jgi:2-polyprenyl-3-methyl-5-hydroxy-6-metoxy-1,4-benzoquinol methylase
MKIELENVSCIICGGNYPDNKVVAKALDFEYETSDYEYHFVECKNCKHVYLNPRPTIGSAHLIYPDTYYTLAPTTEKKGNEKIVEKLKQKIVLKRLESLLKKMPSHARVLEIGCGDGNTLITIKKAYPDFEVVGNDLNFSEPQRKHLEANGIVLIESVFEHAQVPSNHYDLIFMNQLIEHLWDVELCMKKTADTLKPNGMLSISTPNLDGYDRRWCGERLWGGYHTPRHLNLFSRTSLSGYCQEFGLEEIEFNNLSAPLIHITTLGNYFKDKKSKLAKYCNYRNIFLLGVFTIIDAVFMAMGYSTSNQQMIVRKELKE